MSSAWTIGKWGNRLSWSAYAGWAALLTGIYFAVPDDLAQSILYDVIGLSAVLATMIGVHRNRPANPRPWQLFAIGTFLAVLGDALWTAHDAVVGGDPPFPWIADPVYLASYPFLAAGLLVLVRSRHPGRDRAALLDSLIVAVGLGAASWVFLMTPYLRDDALGLTGQLVALTYPVMDIALLGVAVRFLTGGGFRRPALTLLLGGIAILLVADAYYGWAVIESRYQSGDLVDAGWLLSYAAFGVAALHPSMRIAGQREEPQNPARISLRLALLGAVALSGPALLAIRQADHATSETAVLIGASAVLFVLALVRAGDLAVQLNTALEERIAAEARLLRSEERFRGAFTHAPIGMALVDNAGRWRQVNRALCDMLGYAEDELLTTTWPAVVHPDDLDAPTLSARPDDGRSASQIERRYLRKDGRVVWTIQSVSPAPSVAGGSPLMIWQLQDVTARKELEAELRRLALVDPLTGLPNRALFADRLGHALSNSRRDEPVAVLFIDLDRFKVVNDSLGHVGGDRLLILVAERLLGSLRPEDTVARFGGDEFVALLEGLPDPSEATEVAQQLLTTIRAPYLLESQEAMVDASIGVAVGWPGRTLADDLLRHADLALYRAKDMGRATYAIFDPGMGDEAARRSALEIDLRRAVERKEFIVHYQPIVNLADRRVVGAEALVRWVHPVRGLVFPGEFIDLAEETGLIVPMGAAVLEAACRQAASWQLADSDAPPLVMSVNLSARQIRAPGLVPTVAHALASSGLPPEALRLELTEQVLIDEGPATATTLRALKEMGVSLAIDDFGMGYSSLSSLRHLPVDNLKIDRSFVAGLNRDPGAGAIAEAMISLARALNLVVTAEGIETDDQFDWVLQAGCTLGQGFLFSPAVPPEAFEMFLAEERIISIGRSIR